MKHCPTCQRTFDDNMKFCQTDGTPLISDAAGGSPVQDFDPMKTVLGVPPPVDLPPPSPFGSPKSSESDLNSPSFGDLGGSASSNQPSGGFGQQPSGGFSDAPRTPTFQEPEPQFGQQPFGNSPSDWSPPPVPSAGWGNQGLGQNTPFSPPPMAGAGEQNQTLAIVSLVTGILSITCCGLLTGIPALITGFMAKKNAEQNPGMYKGRGMALAGMIMGGISVLFSILYFIYIILAAMGGR